MSDESTIKPAPIFGEVYQGRRGLLKRAQWFGRTVTRTNGHQLMKTSEGYNNRAECEATVRAHLAPGADVYLWHGSGRRERIKRD
jgi:hypothetical protein